MLDFFKNLFLVCYGVIPHDITAWTFLDTMNSD